MLSLFGCRCVPSHRYVQLMADKMKLYAGDEDIDLEELERALTIVKRKMADPEGFPGFLENPEVRRESTLVFSVIFFVEIAWYHGRPLRGLRCFRCPYSLLTLPLDKNTNGPPLCTRRGTRLRSTRLPSINTSIHTCTNQDEEMDNVPALRRKLQRVQVSNLNLTRELERAERMLKAQVCIGSVRIIFKGHFGCCWSSCSARCSPLAVLLCKGCCELSLVTTSAALMGLKLSLRWSSN